MSSQTESSVGRFQSPEFRRRQILDAAARLAVEEGLESTSIANVAKAAGVAKGSIYIHFESRQDLLAALQADLWDRLLDLPSRVMADETLTWTEKVDAVIEHLMRFEFDHHRLHHAIFHTVAAGSDEPLTGARDLLSHLITSGVEAGEFDLSDLDPDVVIQFLIHGYVGPCYHHDDPSRAIANVKQLFHRVLGTDMGQD